MKNCVAIYAEMREGLLADSTDYATKTVREQLKGAFINYNMSGMQLK